MTVCSDELAAASDDLIAVIQEANAFECLWECAGIAYGRFYLVRRAAAAYGDGCERFYGPSHLESSLVLMASLGLRPEFYIILRDEAIPPLESP